MSLRISVLKSSKKGYSWYVTYPDGETRKKKYFKTKAAAEEWAEDKQEDLEDLGNKHEAISDDERAAIIKFREVVAKLPEHKGRITLLEVVQEFENSHKAMFSPLTCQEVATRLQDKLEREGKSATHLENMKGRLARFNREYGDRLVSDISTEIVDDFLSHLGLKSQTVVHYRTAIGQMFQHGVTLRAADSNPVEKSMRPKVVSGDIDVLGVRELSRLLSVAGDKVKPALAISFFAGLRVAEVMRLDWQEIDLEEMEIEIKAANAKSAKRRFVKISENLKAWLEPYQQLAGKVVKDAYTFREGRDEAKKKAGIEYWPHNAGRHSYASYHLAMHEDAGALAVSLGHPDPTLLYSNYRKLVRAKEAAKYWAIQPDTEKPVTISQSA